jgi:hypothetical protein
VALIRPTWDLLLEPDIQVRKYLWNLMLFRDQGLTLFRMVDLGLL